MTAAAPLSVAGLAVLLVIASLAGGGIAAMLARSQAPRPADDSAAPAAAVTVPGQATAPSASAGGTTAAARENAASAPAAGTVAGTAAAARAKAESAPTAETAAGPPAAAQASATRAGGRRVAAESFLEELDKKAKAAPQDVDAWRRLARERYRYTLVDREQLPEAAAALDRVLELEPQDRESIRMRADVAYEARDYDGAVKALQRYLALEPEDRKVRVELASALGFLGDVQAAKAIYLDLIAKKQELFAAHLGLGMVLASEKDGDGALAQFRNARTFAETYSERNRIDGVIALTAGK